MEPRCVNDLCLLFGYSRQSYYQGKKHQSTKAFESDLLIEEVLRHRELLKKTGARKLYEQMQDFFQSHQIRIGRDNFFRLLSEHNLLVRKRRKKVPVTTFSRHRFKKYPNIIKELTPLKANELWVSDITYIPLKNGVCYLSLITDAYSRKIVGHCLSRTLSADGPLQALKFAIKMNKPIEGLIHHSDRGVQYCCNQYIEILSKNGIKISMTENGDPLENPIAERINGILKDELLDEEYGTYNKAKIAINKACKLYNEIRLHGSINNLKPIQAHAMTGKINVKWKNYYKIKKEKEAVMET